jgi:hypothetical protein
MMNIANMTRAEKLSMMEALWDDLSHEPTEFASPEWHEQALKESELALNDNQAGFVSWDAAKKALRNNNS